MKGIGKRVTVGFLSIVALLFVSGMISLFELSNMSNDTGDILSATKRNIEISNDLLNSVNEHGRAVVGVAILGNRTRIDDCRRLMSELEGHLSIARNEALDATRLDPLAESIQQLRSVTDNYFESTEPVEVPIFSADSIVIGTNLEVPKVAKSGREWYDEEYKTASNTVIMNIEEFMTHTHASLAPRAEQLNKNAYRSVAPVLISLLVMILTVLMFYYFIRIYCVKPLLKLNKALKDYMAFRLPFNVKDELIDEYKELYDNIETLVNLNKQQNNKQ